jgi:hypothetical protein
MEVTDRFDESMDGNVWATIVGHSIEFKAANSEGGCWRKGSTRD